MVGNSLTFALGPKLLNVWTESADEDNDDENDNDHVEAQTQEAEHDNEETSLLPNQIARKQGYFRDVGSRPEVLEAPARVVEGDSEHRARFRQPTGDRCGDWSRDRTGSSAASTVLQHAGRRWIPKRLARIRAREHRRAVPSLDGRDRWCQALDVHAANEERR